MAALRATVWLALALAAHISAAPISSTVDLFGYNSPAMMEKITFVVDQLPLASQPQVPTSSRDLGVTVQPLGTDGFILSDPYHQGATFFDGAASYPMDVPAAISGIRCLLRDGSAFVFSNDTLSYVSADGQNLSSVWFVPLAPFRSGGMDFACDPSQADPTVLIATQSRLAPRGAAVLESQMFRCTHSVQNGTMGCRASIYVRTSRFFYTPDNVIMAADLVSGVSMLTGGSEVLFPNQPREGSELQHAGPITDCVLIQPKSAVFPLSIDFSVAVTSSQLELFNLAPRDSCRPMGSPVMLPMTIESTQQAAVYSLTQNGTMGLLVLEPDASWKSTDPSMREVFVYAVGFDMARDTVTVNSKEPVHLTGVGLNTHTFVVVQEQLLVVKNSSTSAVHRRSATQVANKASSLAESTDSATPLVTHVFGVSRSVVLLTSSTGNPEGSARGSSNAMGLNVALPLYIVVGVLVIAAIIFLVRYSPSSRSHILQISRKSDLRFDDDFEFKVQQPFLPTSLKVPGIEADTDYAQMIARYLEDAARALTSPSNFEVYESEDFLARFAKLTHSLELEMQNDMGYPRMDYKLVAASLLRASHLYICCRSVDPNTTVAPLPANLESLLRIICQGEDLAGEPELWEADEYMGLYVTVQNNLIQEMDLKQMDISGLYSLAYYWIRALDMAAANQKKNHSKAASEQAWVLLKMFARVAGLEPEDFLLLEETGLRGQALSTRLIDMSCDDVVHHFLTSLPTAACHKLLSTANKYPVIEAMFQNVDSMQKCCYFAISAACRRVSHDLKIDLFATCRQRFYFDTWIAKVVGATIKTGWDAEDEMATRNILDLFAQVEAPGHDSDSHPIFAWYLLLDRQCRTYHTSLPCTREAIHVEESSKRPKRSEQPKFCEHCWKLVTMAQKPEIYPQFVKQYPTIKNCLNKRDTRAAKKSASPHAAPPMEVP
ncbi:uncharacterized protein MONBRDRAFT_38206 [Monosiga brevicollis MX1]|uniref:Uncharacterized protein n=1 Tax=Monosiga brevicollis TaxID=81824 RepID=A9V6A8_MONBE|nr:uncharacterized protein MONBRDRAFT_38206 [Monosiga brevicollis MX1]EDQ86958.1 predicted protein [Monosiga brevicollis MX1]|eukprot:XP_001748197.1 hypothetical protein [Monosiga brevicollis MX1]